MGNIAIKVEHLSKMYKLGIINNGTLWKDIQTWAALKMGKEDPYSKIGENKYSGDADHFWALKDISFEIQQGDRVGIIGKNGAGKSTLLKLLSRVTSPTEGVIKVRGKIASLLEVGTGFNAELTGRENIYLNGAILGMKTRQIDRKLDEIIAFSEIEHHIDTPVKRYSSGMYVRLAFAVAAHLDSDILIADEVLAVGDAAFQKKALGKMQDLSAGQGKTVLFVSHNLVAVKSLCNKGIVLQQGRIIENGTLTQAVEKYAENDSVSAIMNWTQELAPKNENIEMIYFHVKPAEGQVISVDSGILFEVSFKNSVPDINLDCTIEVSTAEDIIVFHTGYRITTDFDSKDRIYTVSGILQKFILNAGTYKIKLIIGKNQSVALFVKENIVSFEVEDTLYNRGYNFSKMPGVVFPKIDWKLIN